MKVPTKNDLDRLRKLSEIIKNNKKLPISTYKCLMNSENLPKRIKNNISKYFNHFKSGGTVENCNSFTILWPSSGNNMDCTKLLQNKQVLGEGAFGKVFLNDYDDVTKIFIKSEEIFKNHLIQNLPIIIEKLENLNIFTSVFTYNDNNGIAYSMKHLSHIPKIRFSDENPLAFKAILNIAFKKIKAMHEKGIYHCDMKIDNIMYTPNNVDKPNIKQLLDCMNDTMQIVDFDGALIKDQEKTIEKQLNEGHELHPTTPYFAHPWLFEKLYSLKPIKDLGRLDSIEIVRKSSIGDIDLDHVIYHYKIFNNEFDKVFSKNQEKIESYIKFSDYYNTAMSLLQKKIIQSPEAKEGIKQYETLVCTRLQEKAKDLELFQEPEVPIIGGKRRKKKGGSDYHHEIINNYVVEKELNGILIEKGLLDEKGNFKYKLTDEILGIPIVLLPASTKDDDYIDNIDLEGLPSDLYKY